MNRSGHVMTSQMILIIGMGGFLIYLLREHGLVEILTGLVGGITTFLIGSGLPDLDHPKVHKIKWMGKITKHRGHFHSIIAALVYAGLIALIIWPFDIEYWWFIVGGGFFGYICHLIEDDVTRYKLKKKPKRGFKIW